MGLDKTSDLIKKNLNNYKELESVYRKDKKRFKKAINSLHGKVDNKVIEVWYNRLNFETETTFTINKKEILIVILLGLFSGLISNFTLFGSQALQVFLQISFEILCMAFSK